MRAVMKTSIILLGVVCAAAFSPPLSASTKVRSVALAAMDGHRPDLEVSACSRRYALERVAAATFAVSASLALPPDAIASGGATAGGAYLLSAKQRYNARVTAGVKGFLALSKSIEAGSIVETKAFLSSSEEGGWGDLKAAGYLLSNAFRRSSNTAPDSLPSVKAWKAFQGQVDAMQKAIDKKSKSGVGDSYKKAEALLDDYLEKVELPPAIEI